MHVARRADLQRHPDGAITIDIDPGDGTAPDVQAGLAPTTISAWPSPWRDCFTDWPEMLRHCVPQDRAMSVQPWRGRVVRQEIVLNIPLEKCRPVAGEIHSRAATALAGEAVPMCFHIDRISFRLLKQEWDGVDAVR